MERIWNSSNNDSLSVRRFSNTVNLKVGQRVYGRVISMSENQQAIIRLLNGAELHANIEGIIGEFQNELLNFRVEGLKDGKLQLKLIQGQKHKNGEVQTDLLKFIDKEGLSKEDMPTLQGMLKYGIPLTKENITEVKGLIQFQQKISSGNEDEKVFINNYLNSKGIIADNPNAEVITNKLMDFINNFKNMAIDNILLFLENGIDFSSENIVNYNKMFKGNESIFNILDNVADGLDNLNVISWKNIVDDVIDFEGEIDTKSIEPSIKDKLEITKELTSILKDNNIAINSNSSEVLYNIIDKTIEKAMEDVVKMIITKDRISDEKDLNDVFTKPMLEEKLTEVIGQKVTVFDEKFEKLCDLIGVKSGKESILADKDGLGKEIIKEVIKENIGGNIKESIVTKESESKEIIKNLLSLLNSEGDSEEQGALMQLVKSSINEVKLFNKFSDNYYYLNIPLNYEEKEYPCKLVIKDDRKEGKKIDSKNLKLAVNINTGNLGVINSFIKVNNKNMNIELQCEKNFQKVFEISKHNLKDKIEKIGFNVNITVTKVKEEFSLSSCRDFFGDNNIAGIDITV